MCDIMYLGDHCGNTILISNILNKKDKLLFMLGGFPMNSITKYLKEGKLQEIYDTQFLKPFYDRNISLTFDSSEEVFTHQSELEYCITNTKYNFNFHHDFKYNNATNVVSNYNFIVNQYNLKIKNTLEMFKNNNPILFINFLWEHETVYNQLQTYVNDMKNVLKRYIPHKKFYILLFTTNQTIEIKSDDVFLLKLQQFTNDWPCKTPKQNFQSYKEIYKKFYKVVEKLKLTEHFPDFQNTYYHKQVRPS